jgi:hypothetical protein
MSNDMLYADDFCIIREHRESRIAIQTGRPPEDATPTVVDAETLLPELAAYTNTDMSELHEQIHERLVVEEPNAEQLLAAVEGAVQIVRGRHTVLTTDCIHDREPTDRVITYLLGRYCATRLSDGSVSMATDRSDLIDRFGRDVVNDALGHGWIEHWDESVRLRPQLLNAAAEEIARKYADDGT